MHALDAATLVTMLKAALEEVLFFAGPAIGCGLLASLLTSFLQGWTHINEVTLTFVPKMAGVAAAAAYSASWVAIHWVDLTHQFFALALAAARIG